MKVLIIGGDKRNLCMINNFDSKELDVVGFNIINGINNKQISDIDISMYDIIIFPIDGIKKDYSITTNYNDDEIIIPKNFFVKAKKNSYVFSGINSETLDNMTKHLNYIRLLDYEDVNVKNGILTSEGIIADIIHNTGYSIKDANIIVFGYGRVARPLIKCLEAIGANVMVGVKETRDFNNIENSFYTNVNMKDYLKNASIIINTVPNIILDSKNLEYINKDTYILDIASIPYGIDYECATKLGLNTKILSGIPGKVSPVSASLILSEKIKSLVKEVY